MASKRRIRRLQCGSKKKHSSAQIAFIAMKKTNFSDPMCVYKCPHCHCFHIGRKKKQRW